MAERKFHILDGFPRSVSPSSHAAEADGFVFLTGQFGRDLDDPDKADLVRDALIEIDCVATR